MTAIRLTQYRQGTGGGKIAPGVLDDIFAKAGPGVGQARLIASHEGREGAAVFDLGDGRGMIATTSVCVSIVDDPFDFGRIAAINAIGDVYALGGTPVMARGILGWPLSRLDAHIAGDVVAGAQAVCREHGLALAGGHSIEAQEPTFGLAVNGLVDLEHLTLNKGAEVGDLIYLTKPLGVGFLTHAEQQGLIRPGHQGLARETMLASNRSGTDFARIKGLHAMTDITGLGLAGHLNELCEASGVAARLDFRRLPRLAEAEHYRRQGAVPDETRRNREALGERLPEMDAAHWQWLCDPQTAGGLLLVVHPSWADDIERVGRAHGLSLAPCGEIVAASGPHRLEVTG